jgi:hypothetical protein
VIVGSCDSGERCTLPHERQSSVADGTVSTSIVHGKIIYGNLLTPLAVNMLRKDMKILAPLRLTDHLI